MPEGADVVGADHPPVPIGPGRVDRMAVSLNSFPFPNVLCCVVLSCVLPFADCVLPPDIRYWNTRINNKNL